MKKVIKIGFPIVCVSVIGVTFYLLNNAQKKVNELKSNSNTNIVAENKISDSENEENIEENKAIYSVSLEEEKKLEQELEKKEDKAIELAEETYTKVSNRDVYYTSEGMEDDKYIIAVRDEETTETIIYYIIDVIDETVEIYY